MAQESIFWTTGVAGDGLSAYTEDRVFDWLKRTWLSDPSVQAVLPNYLNELEVTGTTSPVSINTGAAVVNGIPYRNTTAETLAVPTPEATTGHRVVLRADYAARTVRLVLLSSATGISAIPPWTQNSSYWEVPLANLTIDSLGNITLSDERGYVHPNILVSTNNISTGAVATAGLADLAVTTGKLADLSVTTEKLANDSVDDTKAGNRVAVLAVRQGGSATDWSSSGTTSYTPTTVRMQAGVATSPSNALSLNQVTITFPVAFSNIPVVQATPQETNGTNVTAMIVSVSATQAVINLYDHSTALPTVTRQVHWLAIGPE